MGIAANTFLAAQLVVLTACTLSTPLENLGSASSASSSGAGGAGTGGGATGGGGAASSSNTGGATAGYRDVVMGDSPLAYWRLGESTGFIAADEAGDYQGQYAGPITYGVTGAIAGDPNTAVEFATSSFVNLGDVLDLTSISIEAWIRPASSTGLELQHIITKRLTLQNEEQGYGIWLHDTSGFGFAMIRDNVYVGAESTLFSAARWNHVVGTFDGSITRLYLNGQEAAQSEANPITVLDTDASLVIGGYDALGGGSFIGAVDEVAVYDKPLTDEQIAAHYQAGAR